MEKQISTYNYNDIPKFENLISGKYRLKVKKNQFYIPTANLDLSCTYKSERLTKKEQYTTINCTPNDGSMLSINHIGYSGNLYTIQWYDQTITSCYTNNSIEFKFDNSIMNKDLKKSRIILDTNISSIGFNTVDNINGECYIRNVSFGKNVKKIESYSFCNCTFLTSMTFVDNDDSTLEIGDYAFAGCSNLVGNIVLPKQTTKIGKGAFYGCKNIISITIPKNCINIDDGAFANTNITFFIVKYDYDKIHSQMNGKNWFNNSNIDFQIQTISEQDLSIKNWKWPLKQNIIDNFKKVLNYILSDPIGEYLGKVTYNNEININFDPTKDLISIVEDMSNKVLLSEYNNSSDSKTCIVSKNAYPDNGPFPNPKGGDGTMCANHECDAYDCFLHACRSYTCTGNDTCENHGCTQNDECDMHTCDDDRCLNSDICDSDSCNSYDPYKQPCTGYAYSCSKNNVPTCNSYTFPCSQYSCTIDDIPCVEDATCTDDTPVCTVPEQDGCAEFVQDGICTDTETHTPQPCEDISKDDPCDISDTCTDDTPTCTDDTPVCTEDIPCVEDATCTDDTPTCTDDTPVCTEDIPCVENATCTDDTPTCTDDTPVCTVPEQDGCAEFVQDGICTDTETHTPQPCEDISKDDPCDISDTCTQQESDMPCEKGTSDNPCGEYESDYICTSKETDGICEIPEEDGCVDEMYDN